MAKKEKKVAPVKPKKKKSSKEEVLIDIVDAVADKNIAEGRTFSPTKEEKNVFKEMDAIIDKSQVGLDEKTKTEYEKLVESFKNSYSVELATELSGKADRELVDLYFEMYYDPQKNNKASARAQLSEKYHTDFVDLAVCGEIMRRFTLDVLAREAYLLIHATAKKDNIVN